MIDYSNHRITASSDPFPHLVIDGWFSDPTERSQNYNNEFDQNLTASYASESGSIMNLIRNNMPGLDSGSKHWRDDLDVEVNHNFWYNSDHTILRDTHVDGPSKYFQVLAYLYPEGVSALPNPDEGALELMAPSGSTGVNFNNDLSESIDWNTTEWEVRKTIPYTHNRTVIFQCDSGSAHRFHSVSGNIGRKTIVTSFVNHTDLCW